jgi:hypothetical protein
VVSPIKVARVAAGQQVDLALLAVLRARNAGLGPALFGAVLVAPVDVVEMGGLVVQIAGEQHHAFRVTAVAVAQVDDQRLGVAHHGHGGGDARGDLVLAAELMHVDIADVGGQPVDIVEAEVEALRFGQLRGLVHRRFGRVGLQWYRVFEVAHFQVLVVTVALQRVGERIGEFFGAGDRIEITVLKLCTQALSYRRGLVRKDVGAIKIGDDAVDHFAAGGLVHVHVFLRRSGLGMAWHAEQREACRAQYTSTGQHGDAYRLGLSFCIHLRTPRCGLHR